MNEPTTLGLDLGMGAMKLFDASGGVQLPAFVAIGGSAPVGRTLGLAATKPAMHITVGKQSYLVGRHAHDQGRPIENLDYERLTGSPEIRALFYASLTERMRAYSPINSPLSCLVGLPLEPLTGDQAKGTVAAVRKWLKGDHHWCADGVEQSVSVADVQVTSQPAGALFDYLLDDECRFIPERKGHMNKELGIVSVGFNTIELLAVRDKTPVQRFTAGSTVGVRRLLELLNREGHYSLGELDTLLRAGALDTSETLPLWAREVTGVIERTWGWAAAVQPALRTGNLTAALCADGPEAGGLHRIFFTGQTAVELGHFIRVATAEPLEIMVLGWLYSRGEQSRIVAGRFTAMLPKSVREKAVQAIKRERGEARRPGNRAG